MYQFIDVDKNNKREYSLFFDADIAENIGRSFIRSMVVSDDETGEVLAGMVWSIVQKEKKEKPISTIIWIKHSGSDVFFRMIRAYLEKIKSEGIRTTKATLPLKDGKEQKALFREAGFNMKLFESDVIIVRLSELSDMPFIKKLRNTPIPKGIMTLSQISARYFEKGVNKCIKAGKTGLCHDLKDLSMAWFEDDVSCVSTGENGINGFFLFHKRPSGIIAVQLLTCLDNSYKTTIPLMMYRFVTAMEEKYGPDTRIELDRHNEQAMILSERLLPRDIGRPVYLGSRGVFL